MNPALPLNHFVPDAEARSLDDGRVFVYGSYDIPGDAFYCSREYHAFASRDLVEWTHHGAMFTTQDDRLGPEWREKTLFAPDCIRIGDRYHLFFCTSSDGEGVATSSVPEGPFTDPRPVAGAHGDAIDPAVFVDDDGAVYYYWGQFHARGARMRGDLAGIDPSTRQTHLITEDEHGFHEGASVRKRNGVYYLVYADISRGRPTALGYATADHPLGPFAKRGIIVDNAGCDPQTWNNHGSIEEVGGRWYVFYHRSSHASRYSRRMCIEPIEFNADGTISEVEMTTGGASGVIDARTRLEASRACLLRGSARAVRVESMPGGGEADVLSQIADGDAACYRYLGFNGERRVEVEAASRAYGGVLEIVLDDPDAEPVGRCEIRPTGGWTSFERFGCELPPVTGEHAVWLRFSRGGHGGQGRLFDLRAFSFGG